jgi:acetyltransferase-like isoleucine patch superfamily enzyme
MGLFLRKITYKTLFAEIGTNVIFGRDITIRHPHEIYIGDNVIIDDHGLLDAKGKKLKGIVLKDNIILGRNTSLVCKEGRITIGSNTQITSGVSIIMAGGELVIGEYVGIGAGSRLIGGNHSLKDEIDEDEVPEWMIPPISKGITLNDRVFLGANVIILDGVSVGRNTVIGAGSLVTKDLPENVIAAGIPAKIIKERKTKN